MVMNLNEIIRQATECKMIDAYVKRSDIAIETIFDSNPIAQINSISMLKFIVYKLILDNISTSLEHTTENKTKKSIDNQTQSILLQFNILVTNTFNKMKLLIEKQYQQIHKKKSRKMSTTNKKEERIASILSKIHKQLNQASYQYQNKYNMLLMHKKTNKSNEKATNTLIQQFQMLIVQQTQQINTLKLSLQKSSIQLHKTANILLGQTKKKSKLSEQNVILKAKLQNLKIQRQETTDNSFDLEFLAKTQCVPFYSQKNYKTKSINNQFSHLLLAQAKAIQQMIK